MRKQVLKALEVFALEHQLVAVLREQLHEVFGTGYIFAQRECPLGARIADIAVCSFNEKPAVGGLPRAIARLSAMDAHLLAEIVGFRYTAAQLAARSFVPLSTVESKVASLIRLGLVERIHGRFAPTGWEAHLPAALYAIEAKLSDWRGAVAQAAYYRQFVDKSYVALPEKFQSSSALFRECRRLRLGLILVSTSGAVRTCIPARSSRVAATWRAAFAVFSLRRFMSETGHEAI